LRASSEPRCFAFPIPVSRNGLQPERCPRKAPLELPR
jgi:hypothetical protein